MTDTTATTGGSSFLLPSGPTTIDSSVSNIPDYYQAYQAAILGTGNSLASQPYASYPGQTIANLTPDQQQAQSMVENNVNAAQPYLTQSGNLYNQVGSGFNQQAFNQYQHL
jgi:hypothetical protein